MSSINRLPAIIEGTQILLIRGNDILSHYLALKMFTGVRDLASFEQTQKNQ